MNKKLILSLMMLVVFLRIAYTPQNNYNRITKQIRCTNQSNCLHESAHRFDQEQGYLSLSDEWKISVNNYIYDLSQKEKGSLSANEIIIINFPGIVTPKIKMSSQLSLLSHSYWFGWGGYSEIYAFFAEKSNGDINNIPKSLQKFYNIDDIVKFSRDLWE